MSRRNSLPTAWLKEEADRLRSLDDRVKTAMDAALATTAEDMRAHVHVYTGALKGSGQWSSETDQDGDWAGEISFGGAEAPHAVYELNRKGHSVDDVFARHESTFEAAIRSALDD